MRSQGTRSTEKQVLAYNHTCTYVRNCWRTVHVDGNVAVPLHSTLNNANCMCIDKKVKAANFTLVTILLWK